MFSAKGSDMIKEWITHLGGDTIGILLVSRSRQQAWWAGVSPLQNGCTITTACSGYTRRYAICSPTSVPGTRVPRGDWLGIRVETMSTLFGILHHVGSAMGPRTNTPHQPDSDPWRLRPPCKLLASEFVFSRQFLCQTAGVLFIRWKLSSKMNSYGRRGYAKSNVPPVDDYISMSEP